MVTDKREGQAMTAERLAEIRSDDAEMWAPRLLSDPITHRKELLAELTRLRAENERLKRCVKAGDIVRGRLGDRFCGCGGSACGQCTWWEEEDAALTAFDRCPRWPGAGVMETLCKRCNLPFLLLDTFMPDGTHAPIVCFKRTAAELTAARADIASFEAMKEGVTVRIHDLEHNLETARAEVAEAKKHAANLADSLSYYEKRAVDEAVARMNVKQQLDAERARVKAAWPIVLAVAQSGEFTNKPMYFGLRDQARKACDLMQAAAMPGSAEREGRDVRG